MGPLRFAPAFSASPTPSRLFNLISSSSLPVRGQENNLICKASTRIGFDGHKHDPVCGPPHGDGLQLATDDFVFITAEMLRILKPDTRVISGTAFLSSLHQSLTLS